jgi:hypothetical protein
VNKELGRMGKEVSIPSFKELFWQIKLYAADHRRQQLIMLMNKEILSPCNLQNVWCSMITSFTDIFTS